MKLDLIVWKATGKEREIIYNIAGYVSSLLDMPIEPILTDIAVNDHPKSYLYVFVFGEAKQHYMDVPGTHVWYFPSPKLLGPENKANKFAANKKIEELVKVYKAHKSKETEKEIAFVETKEKITAGEEDTDIKITKQELEYLEKLKQLLSGSKMVIIKGDLRIEVE